jgi:hypothetical protein
MNKVIRQFHGKVQIVRQFHFAQVILLEFYVEDQVKSILVVLAYLL